MIKIRPYYFLILALVLVAVFAPTLSGYLLGIAHWQSPENITLLLKYPNNIIYISSIFLLLLPVLILYFWYLAGIHRYYALQITKAVALLFAGLLLGNIIFSFWKVHITLNPLLNLFTWLHLPASLQKQYAISVLIGLLTAVLAAIFMQKEEYNVLGDAHFATAPEIHKAGFFKEEGILLGKAWGKKLYVGGFEHVLGFAPTGSGKTRSIAIPNLKSWQGSCVANDVKQTLWETTHKYREKHFNQKCYLWAPMSETKTPHRYNPLDRISRDPDKLITDCQRISHILVPKDPKESPMWGQQARSLLVCLLVYLVQSEQETVTLGRVNQLIKQIDFDGWLQALTETNHFHDAFYQNAYSYLNQPEKTRGSSLSTLTGYFELFGDPALNYATSATDFDLTQLRKKPMTVYVGIPPSDIARLSPLVTLFWEQVIQAMLVRIPKADEPNLLLCLLDEFSEMGRIEVLRSGLKILREYRVRCILLTQQLSQMRERYTEAEAKAFTSIKTKIVFTPDCYDDAEYISRLLGKKTIKVRAESGSRNKRGENNVVSYNYQIASLMRSEKIQKIKYSEMLIIKAGALPILCKKLV